MESYSESGLLVNQLAIQKEICKLLADNNILGKCCLSNSWAVAHYIQDKELKSIDLLEIITTEEDTYDKVLKIIFNYFNKRRDVSVCIGHYALYINLENEHLRHIQEPLSIKLFEYKNNDNLLERDYFFKVHFVSGIETKEIDPTSRSLRDLEINVPMRILTEDALINSLVLRINKIRRHPTRDFAETDNYKYLFLNLLFIYVYKYKVTKDFNLLVDKYFKLRSDSSEEDIEEIMTIINDYFEKNKHIYNPFSAKFIEKNTTKSFLGGRRRGGGSYTGPRGRKSGEYCIIS